MTIKPNPALCFKSKNGTVIANSAIFLWSEARKALPLHPLNVTSICRNAWKAACIVEVKYPVIGGQNHVCTA